ncbi:MAG TPA: hypothetical protein VL462_00570 [Candidatus Nitrosotalea sp.]|jgi:hypothetical protein|nr:hypothetical protein [Candidatus Nitrosotalea sp.]
MQRVNVDADVFFPLPDYDTHDHEIPAFAALGYSPILLCVFDHILTAEEANNCGIMFYEEARERNKLDAYFAGEKRFLSFYRDLAKEGVYLYRDDTREVWQTSADDPEFIAVLTNSLREVHPEQLMDVYFIGPAIRARGGFDRTDLLYLRNPGYLPTLTKLVQQHGLHLLPVPQR